MQTKGSSYQSKLSAFGTLKSAISSFQTAVSVGVRHLAGGADRELRPTRPC